MRKVVVYLFLAIFCLLFFSYKLTQVPPGLTIDESAFGYNAILLSETLRDENNRFLPVFVLSLNRQDWRQPITQYFITIFFKIFGPSIFNLRFTSVIVATIGTILIFILARLLLGNFGGFMSVLFFVTTPILMIHSHLGLDNIMPIPFVLLWLIFLFLFDKKEDAKYLILSGISLGISFYSYKGMRAFAPTWSLLTVVYLAVPFAVVQTKSVFKKIFKPVLTFSLNILPFYAIIPYLELKFAGAVLGQAGLKIDSIYKFLYSYLASFDPSFLFIKGDKLPHHSTQVHGMLLLASLPFFILGISQAFKKGKFWIFLLISFFAGPLLFGFPGSVHRASRLMAMIPLYSLICGLGAEYLWSKKKIHKAILALFIILLAVNYYDFVNYYWFSYSKDAYHIFYRVEAGDAYKMLLQESKKRNLSPYVSFGIVKGNDATETFLRSIHFPLPYSLAIWAKNESDLPKKAILMSNNTQIPNLKKLDTSVSNYYFFTRE